MGNWAKPVLPDAYPDFLDSLVARDLDTGTMFLVDPTNPPIGVIRYNRSINLFQEWNGSTWVNKVIAQAGGGTGAGSLPALGTMASQNANNVAITGGNVTNLSSLGSNGNISAGVDVTAGRNLGVTGTAFTGAVQSSGAIVSSINIQAGTSVLSVGNTHVRGSLYTGPTDRLMTVPDGRIPNFTSAYFAQQQGHEITNLNGSAIDRGSVNGTFLGSGYSNTGAKVLIDNGTWVDKNQVGGGMIEIIHNDITFGTDEMSRQFIIPWNILPVAINKITIEFRCGNNPIDVNGSIGNLSYTLDSVTHFTVSRRGPLIADSYPYTAFNHITQV